ncbi:hypothetical protein JKF63_04359 [Porcisia hertigi]|uniref:Mitochondrial carrier protein n=1 Tax=Porcisia hertigi TaxID=2761500 RepID=A0A836IVV4_9TRYP|nr:hypothetical protein JKF63_04359 [Porcisia hertigi]
MTGTPGVLTHVVEGVGTHSADVPREQRDEDGFFYAAGPALVSGTTQAILFNPIDRALYVRVKYRRPRFLDRRNFERPFQGFMNAVVYRTLVGSSYIFLQDSMRIAIERLAPAVCQAEASPQVNSVLIGLAAGSLNGFALNALQVVKFRMWNTDDRGVTFLRTAVQMYREGGSSMFFRGCLTTMARDGIFGVVYETVRRASAWRLFFDKQVGALKTFFSTPPPPPSSLSSSSSPPQLKVVVACAVNVGSRLPGGVAGASAPAPALDDLNTPQMIDISPDAVILSSKKRCDTCAFISNLVAAVLASILSSPFNYVRSIVYGTPAGAVPLGYFSLLKSFYTQLYYTYRHGESYTDRHGVPELSETEHPSSASASSSSNSSTATSERRWRRGGCALSSAEVKSGVPQKTRRWRLWASHHAARARTWAQLHHHHPKAAWAWANSRLNIGWGSLRVGLGMATGQSIFYLAQDYARKGAR